MENLLDTKDDLNNKILEIIVTKVLDIQKQELEFKNEFINKQFQSLFVKNKSLEKKY